MTFFTALGGLICWTMGGLMVVRGEMTLGSFYRVTALLALVYGPLQWFGQLNQWFSRAMAGAERIFEIVDSDTEKYGDKGKHVDIVGEVEFEAVRFGYDKSNPILKGTDLHGETGRNDRAGRQVGRGQVHND